MERGRKGTREGRPWYGQHPENRAHTGVFQNYRAVLESCRSHMHLETSLRGILIPSPSALVVAHTYVCCTHASMWHVYITQLRCIMSMENNDALCSVHRCHHQSFSMMCVCVHINLYTCTCIYTYVCVCIFIQTYLNIHIYVSLEISD